MDYFLGELSTSQLTTASNFDSVTGLHACPVWFKKLPYGLVQLGSLPNFFSSNYISNWTACSPKLSSVVLRWTETYVELLTTPATTIVNIFTLLHCASSVFSMRHSIPVESVTTRRPGLEDSSYCTSGVTLYWLNVRWLEKQTHV